MTDPRLANNIQTRLESDGILIAVIDMPGRAMNVFSRDMMDSLEALLTLVETDAAIRGVVLTSGKGAFLAGADLDMIRMFTERARDGSTAELNQMFGHLGRLFRRLELSPKPYVAAINGLALGGGLEVCLACHERVISSAEGVQLGLPEVKLGLLPGAGGTQRLPRLVGTAKGLEMLLIGDPVGAQEALNLGLVDEIAAPDELVAVAARRARALSAPAARWDRPGFARDAAPYDFTAPDAYSQIATALSLSDYQLQYYPAYKAIMDCVVGGWTLPMTQASDREMDIFVELMRDPVAGNMVRSLFLNRQKAAKAGLLSPTSVFASGDEALLPTMKRARDRARELKLGEEDLLLAVALAALGPWAAGKVEQPSYADVAAVIAGLFPSYAGGPFTFLQQHGATTLKARAAAAAARDAKLFAVPAALDAYCATAT